MPTPLFRLDPTGHLDAVRRAVGRESLGDVEVEVGG